MQPELTNMICTLECIQKRKEWEGSSKKRLFHSREERRAWLTSGGAVEAPFDGWVHLNLGPDVVV